MSFSESLRIALRGLATNKLRAALTMLGIIIGVAAVITLLSVGQGVEQYVTAQFQGIGSSLLFVFPGGSEEQSGPGGAAREKPLTNQDGEALADPYQVPGAKAAALEFFGVGTVEYGRETLSLQVSGVSPNYQQVRQFFVEAGSFFTETDDRAAARVAVIGQTVVKTLFPGGEYPIGQTIKINRLPFKVVGVLEPKGGGLFGDQDAVVLIPLGAAQQRLFNARAPDGKYFVSVVYVQARDGSDAAMESLAREITAVLRERHNIQFRDEDDFTIVTQNDLISAFGEVTGVLTIFLGAIAGISLLVGGVGIMNIMLVSVTERTREIGLRKSVGAKRRDILWQFLIEAMTLSLLGGVVGILLGIAGARAVVSLQPDVPVAVTLDSVLLATGFSAAIGLFFGLYPAVRAAALNPIEALRYE